MPAFRKYQMAKDLTKDELLHRRFKVFFSAAERSGDKHASRLIERLREKYGNLEFEGLGGDQMESAGCYLMENLMSRSAMLTHALKQVFFYWNLRSKIRRHFDENPPDLVVVVDSPAWNFHVARAAKEHGIPVLYYIAPQLWAWGSWRLNKLKRCIDKVACILPFEEAWFTQRGVNATFVGHPLFDRSYHIADRPFRTETAENYPTVALLPGSRKHEIETLWQPMQQIARKVKKEYPEARFVSAAPSREFVEFLTQRADRDLMIDIQHRHIEATVRYADLALVASGTATLEVAAQGCPMLVMYHVPALQWNLVGRWLLKTPFISLVNILSGRELVPELIPFGGRIQKATREALDILGTYERRHELNKDLLGLIKPLVEKDAPEEVAELIRELLPHY